MNDKTKSRLLDVIRRALIDSKFANEDQATLYAYKLTECLANNPSIKIRYAKSLTADISMPSAGNLSAVK